MDGGGGRRHDQGVTRQANSQGPGTAREDERRVHGQRLAVDRDMDRARGPDLEPRRLPLQPAREPADLPHALQGDELPRLRGPVDPGRDDAKSAVVQVLTGAAAADPVKLVPVVGDEDEVRGGIAGAVGPAEPQVQRRGVRAEQFWQHAGRGLQLGVPVLR
jgi:hypothetical protein